MTRAGAPMISECSGNTLPSVITALFLENIVNPAQLNRIAAETGVQIGGTLYSDALTDAGGQAPTYIDLMRHNIRTLSAALKK